MHDAFIWLMMTFIVHDVECVFSSHCTSMGMETYFVPKSFWASQRYCPESEDWMLLKTSCCSWFMTWPVFTLAQVYLAAGLATLLQLRVTELPSFISPEIYTDVFLGPSTGHMIKPCKNEHFIHDTKYRFEQFECVHSKSTCTSLLWYDVSVLWGWLTHWRRGETFVSFKSTWVAVFRIHCARVFICLICFTYKPSILVPHVGRGRPWSTRTVTCQGCLGRTNKVHGHGHLEITCVWE